MQTPEDVQAMLELASPAGRPAHQRRAGRAPRLADPAQLAGIRSDLPILIASGDADPLAGGGALVELLGQRYRDADVADVTVTLYPDARHEILNEIHQDEVTADIVAWLRAQTA
jgi:alpha-beta hydrolase superfamily lysophospholipase